MKKILFVEDNALITRIYSQKLTEAGFEVGVAEDGEAAIKLLPGFKPDLVVLDLLMPKSTGAEVLKFIRRSPELHSTRVVVFSNSFLGELVKEVAAAGVQKTLIKSCVTPTQLVNTIHEVLQGPEHGGHFQETESSAGSKPKGEEDEEFKTRVQLEFVERAPGILKDIRHQCEGFVESADSSSQPHHLEDLTRKVGLLTHMTSIAGHQNIAHLSSALEALLFELQTRPEHINDSSRHTVASTVAFLAAHYDDEGHAKQPVLSLANILIVDDDAVVNLALSNSLSKAGLAASSVADPNEALKKLRKTPYDLVLIDVNMPGIGGMELCEQMRAIPLHRRTPVIFITSNTDFKTRSRSVLSGGDELITKPILPVELCVKAITYLLKGRFAGTKSVR